MLRRAAGAVALDDEDLGSRGVALLAIRELAGKAREIERALAPRQVAGLARGLARDRGLDHLAHDLAGIGRMLLEPLLQLVADDALDHRPHLGRDQLFLGLGRELGIGHLHREDAGQSLAHVLADQLNLVLLGDPAGDRVVVDAARERSAEARQMRAAVPLRDVVGEAEHGLVVAVGPLHGDLDRDALALAQDRDRRAMDALLCAVEIFDESL